MISSFKYLYTNVFIDPLDAFQNFVLGIEIFKKFSNVFQYEFLEWQYEFLEWQFIIILLCYSDCRIPQQDSLLEENALWVFVSETPHFADETIEVRKD